MTDVFSNKYVKQSYMYDEVFIVRQINGSVVQCYQVECLQIPAAFNQTTSECNLEEIFLWLRLNIIWDKLRGKHRITYIYYLALLTKQPVTTYF